LKRQGLLLAVFSMMVFLVAGIIFLLIPGTWWKFSGAAVSALSVFFLVYLRLPSIEQRFDSTAQTSRA